MNNPFIFPLYDTFQSCPADPYWVMQYTGGHCEPHYPMPSIAGHVQITKYAVYLADPEGYGAIEIWRKDR